MSLSEEFALIEAIKRTLGKPSGRVKVPIGDDAAFVKASRGGLVATIDTMVQGVHFDLAYMTPGELGHKALAVNLSDIAAMGAEPQYILVSLGLTQELSDHFVLELYAGMRKLAKKYKVDVVGGNLVQCPQVLVVDVVALGQASRVIKRSGAKVGDLVGVTGQLGASAAGLNLLKRFGRLEVVHRRDLMAAHLTPEPRVREALALQRTGAVTSMIDVSDGFAREVHHLAKASRVGFLIDEAKLPITETTKEVAALVSLNARAWALYGGEDYELLFTFKASQRRKIEAALKPLKTRLSVVGEVTDRAQGIKIKTTAGETMGLEPMGWNHFVRRKRLL